MAFAFDPADPDLGTGLRRIAAEEMAAALARFSGIDDPDAIHGIRKNLKKTRALLRLVRAGFKPQPALNLTLREVGLALSARRDAQVRLATLDRLFPAMPQALLPPRAALAGKPLPLNAVVLSDLQQSLATFRDGIADWSLSGKDDRTLRQGLATTRARARHAAHAAKAHPAEPDRIHDWRKHTKDHWYQARLFAPTWPEVFKPIVASADRLGEILGDHHDLSVLATHIAGLGDAVLSDLARRMFDARLRDAQAKIEAEAFALGARLFAGDPDDVAGLWVDWHKVWRTKP